MIANILSRLKNSPDREHEMSLNRLIFLSLIAAYTFWINPSVPREALISRDDVRSRLRGHRRSYSPQAATNRRSDGSLPSSATSRPLPFQLHYVGETSSVLFLLYLWITFGNGFRFGSPVPLYCGGRLGGLLHRGHLHDAAMARRHLSLGDPAAEPHRASALCEHANPEALQRQGAGGGGQSGEDACSSPASAMS